MKSRTWITILSALALAPAALAHPGHMHGGLTGGFSHPFTGIDHMLAMIAVGMWAARMGGKSVWQLPLVFMALMFFGGVLATSRIVLPAVESTIAASVLVLGLALAYAIKPPIGIATILVAAFATFHGYAHVAEAAQVSNPAAYMAGFSIATALLQVVGILIGFGARQLSQIDLVRWAGAAIAACGLALCLGLL